MIQYQISLQAIQNTTSKIHAALIRMWCSPNNLGAVIMIDVCYNNENNGKPMSVRVMKSDSNADTESYKADDVMFNAVPTF